MIRQSELQQVVRDQRRLKELARATPVCEYLQLVDTIGKQLAALRERSKRDEAVAPGRLRLEIKRVATVSWEKLLAALRELPVLRAAISREPEALRMLAEAGSREAGSPFVGERISVEVVEA